MEMVWAFAAPKIQNDSNNAVFTAITAQIARFPLNCPADAAYPYRMLYFAEPGELSDVNAVNFLTRAQQLQPGDWTIYSAMGINYGTVRHDDPLGRGFEYIPTTTGYVGKPILELFQ